MRKVSLPLFVFSLATFLVGCNSTDSGPDDPSGAGGQSGKGSAGSSTAEAGTSTPSSGTGGIGGTGGTKAGTGGAGGTKATSETGGAIDAGSPAQGGSSAGGRAGGGGADRGVGGSAGRAAGGGLGSGGSSDAGAGDATADGGPPGKECTPPTSYPNLFVTVSGHTQAESDEKVSKAWSTLFDPKGSGTIYYDGPGSDESYVEDINNNDVRSEGMSYGMMVAVQLNHQTEFDRLWTWVKKHMANGTGEISWSCSTSGNKNSQGGAPDGEEYFATALIFAHNRWGDSTGPGKIAYGTEAQWVLDVTRTKYFNSQYHLVKFVANSNNVDPSYILPAFYEVWACFDTKNAAFWSEAATAGREYLHKVVDNNGVCPYQASYTGQQTQAANADSLRCVVNIMMDWYLFGKDTWQRDTYAPKFGAYSNSHNSGGAQISCNSTLGFALPESSGKAFVDKLWSTPVPSHNYWDGVLYMLAMVHLSGNFHIW